MMVAVLVSFQALLKRHESSGQTVDSTVYASWWSSDSWARGWSRGSVVFFGVSCLVVAVWTFAEVLGHLVGVGTKYGNFWMSVGSVCVNVVLFVGIMLLLSLGASDERTDTKLCGEWYGRYFQQAMLRMLGSSGENHKNQSSVQLDWSGRLLYLRNEMAQFSNETKEECRALVTTLEEKLEHNENHLRTESAAIERGLTELRSEKQAMKQEIQESLSEILRAVQAHRQTAGV